MVRRHMCNISLFCLKGRYKCSSLCTDLDAWCVNSNFLKLNSNFTTPPLPPPPPERIKIFRKTTPPTPEKNIDQHILLWSFFLDYWVYIYLFKMKSTV